MGGKIVKNESLRRIISEKNYKVLIENFSIKDVVFNLNFKDVMFLIDYLFYDISNNNCYQRFALDLAFEVRKYHSKEWGNDWKNEVFLSELCILLWQYEEGYNCCKRAYDSLSDPPEELLLRLADYYFGPEPLMKEEEYVSYVKRAIEKKLTVDSAKMMRALYQKRNEEEQIKHWDLICKQLEGKNLHTEVITPNVFKIENR
jgi:hypothetical protein